MKGRIFLHTRWDPVGGASNLFVLSRISMICTYSVSATSVVQANRHDLFTKSTPRISELKAYISIKIRGSSGVEIYRIYLKKSDCRFSCSATILLMTIRDLENARHCLISSRSTIRNLHGLFDGKGSNRRCDVPFVPVSTIPS